MRDDSGAWRRELRRVMTDEAGNDIVEYALLVAGIGFAGVAAWTAIEAAIGASYTGLEAVQQDLWEPADPQ